MSNNIVSNHHILLKIFVKNILQCEIMTYCPIIISWNQPNISQALYSDKNNKVSTVEEFNITCS